MNEQPDLLRDSLHRIADRADPADLYERSLQRSRRITRNRALLATAAAVVGLSLAGGAVGQLADRARPVVPPPAASAAPAPPDRTVPGPARTPSPGATTGTGRTAGSVPGIPGWLYYVDPDADRLVRLTGSGPVVVLNRDGFNATVSPDGRRIAYLTGTEATSVVVADRDGRNPRTVLRDSAENGHEPTWSPDSTRLLVARGTDQDAVLGTVRVDTGTFTPLARQTGGIHHLWSADGRRLGYATGECRLGVADADGRNARLVPVVGDPDRSANPRGLSSCDPYSISPDGSRLAVAMVGAGQPNGDIARDLVADAVVDTRTGTAVDLPVTGTVSAVLFGPDGSLLVRSASGGGNQLTLVSPAGTVTARVAEPAGVRRFSLLAHTAG